MENEAVTLARRLKSDSVWKLVNLEIPVAYGSAAAVASEGIADGDMTVVQVDLCGRISDAWELMLANWDKPLSDVYPHYASIFGSATKLPDTEKNSQSWMNVLTGLWGDNRVLAALCSNHVLVHTNIGLLGVNPKNADRLVEAVEHDRKDWLERHAIERIPGGLTLARMEEMHHG
ncbi:hypothetical protein JS533_004890 [Bifidobacterium amazonense]|uniref:Uncharacterized protein n=1 Tax=Bifidobacterium amazonense TaxID=2809027 RepID=A0ABS9VU30_9BIFI|nr:hypothetical protein [Bifidobacterium amazonense]MCH9275610.1 hypothetical protein [Bifidobacterium amazonense]